MLLTVLVILHHTAIAYGAPGGWYFTQPTHKEGPLILMTLFVATNQAFFMGMFFFLAALFTPASYDKKGAVAFVLDRLKRLGLPLLFYTLVFGPLLNFLVYRYGQGKTATFLQYLGGYDDWIDFGVLWFVLALLLFTILYVLFRKWAKPAAPSNGSGRLPSTGNIFYFALALGLFSYWVRIFLPVGWVLKPLGFQPAHFSQYIALFVLGTIAARRQWLQQISFAMGRRFAFYAIVLVFFVFPLVFTVKSYTGGGLEDFMGGGSLLSLLTALWEQLTGFSIIIALLGIAAVKWNRSTPLLQSLGRSAYATYIFHPFIVIVLTLLFRSFPVDPSIKFLLAGPAAVLLSFLLGSLVVKIPLVKNIL